MGCTWRALSHQRYYSVYAHTNRELLGFPRGHQSSQSQRGFAVTVTVRTGRILHARSGLHVTIKTATEPQFTGQQPSKADKMSVKAAWCFPVQFAVGIKLPPHSAAWNRFPAARSGNKTADCRQHRCRHTLHLPCDLQIKFIPWTPALICFGDTLCTTQTWLWSTNNLDKPWSICTLTRSGEDLSVM